MDTALQSRQEIGEEKPARGTGERGYQKHVLGSFEVRSSTNSLAPFTGFSTSAEPYFPERSHPDIAPANVLVRSTSGYSIVEAENEQGAARNQELRPFGFRRITSSLQIDRQLNFRSKLSLKVEPYISSRLVLEKRFIAELKANQWERLTAQERQATEAAHGIGAEQQHRPSDFVDSRIDLAPGVEAWAVAKGLWTEVRIVAALCLELVPKSQRVVVTMTHDPEDGSEGLNFRTNTQASVEEVVAAEDDLHEQLFRRVPPAKLSSLSILYNFVG